MLSNATTIAINSGSNEGSSVSIEKQSVKIVENNSKLIFPTSTLSIKTGALVFNNFLSKTILCLEFKTLYLKVILLIFKVNIFSCLSLYT